MAIIPSYDSLFDKGNKYTYSIQNKPFQDVNSAIFMTSYQYKREALSDSGSFADESIVYTLTNATATSVENVHPHQCNQNTNLYSSQGTIVPMCSTEYGTASKAVTATTAGGSAEFSIRPIKAITNGIQHFRVLVSANNASSTGKIQLMSSPTDYVEYSYTTPAVAYSTANRSFLDLRLDLNAGTETGTFDRDNINKIKMIVDTLDHTHYYSAWETAQLPLQFTGSVLALDLSQCVKTYEMNQELSTIDLECAGSVSDSVADTLTLTATITVNKSTLLGEALAGGQLYKVNNETNIRSIKSVTLDSSGEFDLSSDISSESELVKTVVVDGSSIPIIVGTQTGSKASLVLNPTTLVLSGGADMAGKSLTLRKISQVKAASYQLREIMSYFGEFFAKIPNLTGGYDTVILPKVSMMPASKAYSESDSDTTTYMVKAYQTQDPTDGRKVYGRRYKLDT